MVSKNSTNDYVVLRGPSRIDPEIYKTATLAILFITIVILIIIQICRKRYLRHCKMCLFYTKDQHALDVKDQHVKTSLQSTTCPSSNRSDRSRKASEKAVEEDLAAKEVRLPMLDPLEIERTEYNNPGIRITTIPYQEGEDPEKIEVLMEQLIDDTCGVSCLKTASASQNYFSKNHDLHNRAELHNDLNPTSELDGGDSLQRRKRRSAVCVSMPHGQDLPETSKSPTLTPRSLENVVKQRKEQMEEDCYTKLPKNATCLPELQVNGKSYDDEIRSSENGCKDVDINDDATDEGQLQCVVKYDEQKSVLNLSSVSVRATMDPGVPGFFVEASLLPRKGASAKSKVYLFAQREVDLVINEDFDLSCSAEDIETNSLFIAVKPMFSSIILYAETELIELSLSHDKEVMLGGNLKSLIEFDDEFELKRIYNLGML